MDPRTIDDWQTIIGRLPSPTHESVEQTVANRILGDLIGYGHRSRHRTRDVNELANALSAYARLVHDDPVERELADLQENGHTSED